MPRVDPLREKNISLNKDKKPAKNHFEKFTFQNEKSSDLVTVDYLIREISSMWDEKIVPKLLSKFGRVTTLYAIFYLEEISNKVVLEVWDPNCLDLKSSQVFTLSKISSIAKSLPKSRENAEIITLNEWY